MNAESSEDPSALTRPPGRADRLLYNRPSNTLVAVMAGLVRCPPAERLYYRRLPATVYSPVGVGHELESQQDAHCCEAAPFLVFNEMRFREPEPVPGYVEAAFQGKKPPPEKGWAGDWFGVRRVNLDTGEDVRVVDEESLHPPPPYTSGWVSRILSVSADGSEAVCVVGLTTGARMKYFVFEVSLTKGLKRQVAELPNVFL